ncbi:hypothetical protein QCA50_008330 [Cerrena zonata]|uniref:Uncharacterized protein n=1 Tax=Cerrena zonata TaxID=2478898 RepID=A0AAW0GCA6_9APHY
MIVGVITRAIYVAANAAVLVLTLWKTLYIFKMDQEVRANSKLTSALLLNGSVHFGVLLILNVILVVLDVLSTSGSFANGEDFSIFIVVEEVINSIILSHFILDLRSIYHTPNNTANATSQSSTLRFASVLEGNMGATLTTIWTTGEGVDADSDSSIQYSEYPFSAGLANCKEEIGMDEIQDPQS